MAVSEQPTILSRIGNWFRRSRTEGTDAPADNDNGHPADVFDPGLGSAAGGPGNGGGNNLLPTGQEPRSTFLRPWAKRDHAIEQLQGGINAIGDLMTGIRNHLEQQRDKQKPEITQLDLSEIGKMPAAYQRNNETGDDNEGNKHG